MYVGFHDGQRVWGGGIVKYKNPAEEWLAWPIDLESDESHSLSGLMGGKGMCAFAMCACVHIILVIL